jgi:hypothetical protein
VPARPAGEALKLRPVRIALWDRYGGSSPSGWTRWMLERFEFPFQVVYAPDLDAGDLARRFDVLILTDEAVPVATARRESAANVPPEFLAHVGAMTTATTVPRLKQFVEDGGTLIAIGGSTGLAASLGVPVSSALVENGGTSGPEAARPLTREKYYIPGSLLRVSVDNATPLAYGFENAVEVFFDNSPVFRLDSGAEARGVRRVAWFADGRPLRSGWAWGQHYLEGGVAVVDAPVGRGRVLLFGPEINYRAQPHGTFKFLFNGIYYGTATAVGGPSRETTQQ